MAPCHLAATVGSLRPAIVGEPGIKVYVVSSTIAFNQSIRGFYIHGRCGQVFYRNRLLT